MSAIKERDVYEAAIGVIHAGFTVDGYFENSHGGGMSSPGAEVGATCAIGGVEQAIWKLTGETDLFQVRRVAQSPAGRIRVTDFEGQKRLYARCMKRLNRISASFRFTYPDAETGGPYAKTIEEITFCASSDLAAKRRVLKVMRQALSEVS